MMMALSAGMTAQEFYASTIGEVIAYLRASESRRKAQTVTQVDAVMRALAGAFGATNDPLDGLVDIEPPVEITPRQVKLLRFWRPSDGD